MASFPPSPLVTTDWLAGELARPDLVILDTSWYLPVTGRSGFEEYKAGHIPGALYFDLDRASRTDTELPHMLPSDADFASYAGTLGIGSGMQVVVYDGSGTNLSAARAWWMFRAYGHGRVTLLDGGLKKWKAEGRPLEAGERTRSPVSFTARLDRSLVRGRAEVEQALASGSAQVLDARSAGRFTGAEAEPREGLPSGHMPGALNLPFNELVRPDGTALPVEDVRQRLRAAGVRFDRPVIASCGSGVTACSLLLSLHRAGYDPAYLYDGSWTEWASSGMPVTRGPAR
jgi:thiosulfate/3-mercaptopyruvate sulfurtransferase